MVEGICFFICLTITWKFAVFTAKNEKRVPILDLKFEFLSKLPDYRQMKHRNALVSLILHTSENTML